MREPFSAVLPRGEPLRAAGEVDLAARTGPLALPAELLALFSPVLSIVLLVRLDGALPKLLGVVLPPLVAILLARFVLRRWRRPREWIGVTDRRLLRWRRAGLLAGPRIVEVELGEMTRVDQDQDNWDRRTGTANLTIHGERQSIGLGRVHNAEALRDAILMLIAPAAPVAGPVPAPRPLDYAPPAPPPGDYRPEANGP